MLELAALLILLVAESWFLRDESRGAASATAWLVVGIIYASSLQRRGVSTLKEALHLGPVQGWLAAGAATVGVVLVTAVWFATAAEPYDSLHLERFHGAPFEVVNFALIRLSWATFQQVVLLTFVWPILVEILESERVATVVAAVLFGILYLPSPGLAVLSAGCALLWIMLFRRVRRLLPLIVSHAILATVASVALPPRVTYDMNVGIEGARMASRYRFLASEQAREILRVVTAESYYQAQGGTDRDWITALYRDILGRTPSAWEVDFWIQWKISRTNERVALHFVIGDEFFKLLEEHGEEYEFPFSREPG